jgi:hypothetical protein
LGVRIVQVATRSVYETVAHHHYISCTGALLNPCGWGAVQASASGKVTLAPYAPFPKAALTAVGASFARPTTAQVAGVQVSVSRAYTVALGRTGTLPPRANVTERLGVFRDTMQRPTIAGVVSYAVIFDGVSVPSYGPASGPGGHELVVIVNAHTSQIVEAFSYR